MTDEPAAVPAKPVDPAEAVIAWLTEGQKPSDIREAIAANFPKEDPQKLLNAAVDHFAKAAECDQAVVVGWALEAYRDLYRRLVAIGDFSGAIKAVKELVTLAAKYAVHDPDEPADDEAQDRIENPPAGQN